MVRVPHVGLTERWVAVRPLATPSPDGVRAVRMGLARTGLTEREDLLNTATPLERAVILTLWAVVRASRASKTSDSSVS